MDELMANLWTVKKFAKWKYRDELEKRGLEEPTKAQVNVVTRQCLNGILPAKKIGKEWRIDVRELVKELI